MHSYLFISETAKRIKRRGVLLCNDGRLGVCVVSRTVCEGPVSPSVEQWGPAGISVNWLHRSRADTLRPSSIELHVLANCLSIEIAFKLGLSEVVRAPLCALLLILRVSAVCRPVVMSVGSRSWSAP